MAIPGSDRIARSARPSGRSPKPEPDAIITELAWLSPILKKFGLRVPDHIGVAALNILDIPFDAGIYSYPEEIGRVGVLAAISFINDQTLGMPPIRREVLIKGDWVDGESLPGVS